MFKNDRHFRLRGLCALTLTLILAVGSASAVLPGQLEEQPQQTVLTDSQPEQAGQSEVAQYLRYAPRLLAQGYSQEEVDLLISSMPVTRILPLLRQDYTPRAAEYVRQPHFRNTLLERYLAYGQANPELAVQQVVTQVNIGLDRKGYSCVRLIDDPGAPDVLVNKYRLLGSTFVPELVKMDSKYASYDSAYMEPTAYEWFTKMVDDARTEGLRLYCVSAYRSYSYQNTLYQKYVNRDGRTVADTYSARPGYSEHQTGLAVDINTASRHTHFENTAQYKWLEENSWKYGFILRYPQGKEDITGFTFEPWHYRYVGRELAQAVYESGLTYDEYVASQPVESGCAAQTVTVQGRTQTLQRSPLRLGGIYYLSARDLALALGLNYKLEEKTVVLSSASASLTLTQDQTQCSLNGTVHTLQCAPFTQGGELFAPLADTAQLMGVTLQETDKVLALSVPLSSGTVHYAE